MVRLLLHVVSPFFILKTYHSRKRDFVLVPVSKVACGADWAGRAVAVGRVRPVSRLPPGRCRGGACARPVWEQTGPMWGWAARQPFQFFFGIVMVKVVPSPSVESTPMFQPWVSMIVRTTDRPMPMPLSRRELVPR